jgi:hypothetical protein
VPERISAEFDYSWKPFLFDGLHLTFRQHVSTRLVSHRCSHWGPAVYKWDGPVTDGPHAGQTGVLIGETSDLRQRIKQYISGTQERGNKLWRETFLAKGDIRLHTLVLPAFALAWADADSLRMGQEGVASANARVAIEQLLVMRAVAEADDLTWVVNARQ